ncbi:hypothetical protein [Enterococcus phage BUCT630]
MIYPSLDTTEPWFLNTGFFLYDIINYMREFVFNSIKGKGGRTMPAPKAVYVKDLATGKTRKFKSQFAADDFFGLKRGYMKDLKTKLGGRNKKFEIMEVPKEEL